MRCEGKVRGAGGWRSSQCAHTASTEVNGTHYCKIHNPDISAARREARDLEWKKKWDAEQKVRDTIREEHRVWRNRAELCVAACIGLTDDEVRSMTKFSRGVIREFFTGSNQV